MHIGRQYPHRAPVANVAAPGEKPDPPGRAQAESDHHAQTVEQSDEDRPRRVAHIVTRAGQLKGCPSTSGAPGKHAHGYRG